MKVNNEDNLKYLDRLWEMTVESYTPAQTPDKGTFKRLLERGDLFIETRSGVVVVAGYALVEVQTPLLLRSIVTDLSFRGCGIASSILWEMTQFYREHGWSRITLHVKQDNPAQKLYFDDGYRVTKVLKNYYAPEGDGLEMEKVL